MDAYSKLLQYIIILYTHDDTFTMKLVIIFFLNVESQYIPCIFF